MAGCTAALAATSFYQRILVCRPLVRLLPDGQFLSLQQALFNSAVMFCLMWGVWWSVKRLCGRETLGRGDVHLIAGLFARLPATTALYSCGVAFLMMIVAVIRKPQPLAPGYVCPYWPVS